MRGVFVAAIATLGQVACGMACAETKYRLTELPVKTALIDRDAPAAGIDSSGNVFVDVVQAHPNPEFSWAQVAFDLGLPDMDGVVNATARAINASGTAVGCSYDKYFHYRVARFENGRADDLGTLGSGYTCAFAINGAGVIGGSGDNFGRAFITEGSRLVDLNNRISRWDQVQYTLVSVLAINDSGQLAVTAYSQAKRAWIAVRLDPVEP
ncbi:hypothetical protein [Ideonella sp. YS5]|uniref:hypothetical protein n=1 Tax=Ideonella sp. YS5 TaxID=3453714 RepID=UPI003EED3855